MNKELVPLKKKIETVAEKVKGIVILSSEDMKIATVILSDMNKYADSVREKKEKITKPLNEALKNARGMFKPLEVVYEEAIEVLRSKMSIYQTSEVMRIEEEKLKIAERVGEGKGKLKVETAIKKIEEVGEIQKEVSTDAGLVQFREVKVLIILDISLIPREYLIIDEKKVLENLKKGIDIPGAKLESKQVPVNYR